MKCVIRANVAVKVNRIIRLYLVACSWAVDLVGICPPGKLMPETCGDMAGMVIIGPGALGILFAVKLCNSGQDVVLVDYKAERAGLLARNGLRLLEGNRVEEAFPRITTSTSSLEPPGYVMVLVKAFQTSAILPVLSRLCSPETLVISLQNGIGAGEILERVIPPGNIFLGTTVHGANKVSEGEVRHAGSGPTIMGPYIPSAGAAHRIKDLCIMFEKAGFDAEAVPDIHPYLWRKLLINIGINPLTALTCLRNGQLLEFPHMLRLQEMAVSEAFKIVEASGIDVGMDLEECLDMVRGVCSTTAGNISSMLQDRLKGGNTEIDFITGAILKKAESMGMEAPVNEFLTRMVLFHTDTRWRQKIQPSCSS